MRIHLVTGAFPVRSQVFVAAKAIALAGRGHQVTVLASEPGDYLLDDLAGRRLAVEYRCPTAHRRRARAAWAAAGAVRRSPRATAMVTRSLHRRHGPRAEVFRRLERSLPLLGRDADVVHFEWVTKAAQCSEVLDVLDRPVVVSCRGTDLAVMAATDERLAGELRRVFERVSAVHCVSDALARMAEGLGADRSRVFVNRPAVDTRWFTPADASTPSDQWLRVVSVGRIHPVKGFGDALRAVRLLLDQGHAVRYTIVGGGAADEVASVRSSVHNLGLDDHVSLTGPMAPEEVRRALWSSDVFLLSSQSEGLSNAALEAMATALPVVSTDVGGMAEAIRNGIDGYLVPPRDPEAMADALGRLAADPDLRAKMGGQGRHRACDQFDIEGQIDRFEALYASLSEGRPVPR